MIVTPEIARRFPVDRRCLLRNFPNLKELRPDQPIASRRKESLFGYVGTVSPDRGALVMVDAINHPTLAGRARLVIAGAVEPALADAMRARDRQGLVDLLGQLSRPEVASTLQRLRAGLVLLQPVQAHMQAYPVKMFEYMAASVPVIASNYPVWKSLLDGGSLALCIDPTDPAQIAAAMKRILDQPDWADEIAKRADQAVRERYNWETECHRLRTTYNHVLQENVI
jgi:glycosyltransferase involved in cell wall biosynthesis